MKQKNIYIIECPDCGRKFKTENKFMTEVMCSCGFIGTGIKSSVVKNLGLIKKKKI